MLGPLALVGLFLPPSMKGAYSSVSKEYHTNSDNTIKNYITLSEKPWKDKKKSTDKMVRSFNRIGYVNRAEQLKGCGTFLEFAKYSNNEIKLHNANFCRARMCPMCAWRRSLKLGYQVSQVLDEALKDDRHKLLFLTLTIQNVKGQDLSNAISEMLKGYNKLFTIPKVKTAVKGAFRALEVTYNRHRNDYHPHLHVILYVDKSYGSFNDKSYISQTEWSNIWKSCMGLEYMPIVDIRKVRPNSKCFDTTMGISAESTKGQTLTYDNLTISDYMVKGVIDDDVKLPNDIFDDVVKNLENALAGRKLVSFRGDLLKIYKALDLEDPEDGDLINVADQDIRPELEFILLRYCWMMGDYVLLNDDNEPSTVEPTFTGTPVIDGDTGIVGETYYCVQFVDNDGVFDTIAYYDTYSELANDIGSLANDYDVGSLFVYFHSADGFQDLTSNFHKSS